MKRFKLPALVVLILLSVGGGLFYEKIVNQPEAVKPIRQQASIQDDFVPIKKIPKEGRFKDKIPDLGIQASSVILMDAKTGAILYDKNINQPLPTASMSKIMTELLVLEAIEENRISWDKEISISDYVSSISNHPGFASVHLNKGQVYSVRELFHAMAIHSANGAAIALAEAVSGTEKEFVQGMNEKAKQLGLLQTQFVNSTGLNNQDLGDFYSTGGPNDTNVMSAMDMATLARELIQKFPDILTVVDQAKLTFGNGTYINTNWMLPETNHQDIGFEGVDGLKTGYTDEAGYCFTGTVKRDGKRFISVVMGAASEVSRFSETEKLYDAAFN